PANPWTIPGERTSRALSSPTGTQRTVAGNSSQRAVACRQAVSQAHHSAAVVQEQPGGAGLFVSRAALSPDAQALDEEDAARAGDKAIHGKAVEVVERQEAQLPRPAVQAVAAYV